MPRTRLTPQEQKTYLEDLRAFGIKKAPPICTAKQAADYLLKTSTPLSTRVLSFEVIPIKDLPLDLSPLGPNIKKIMQTSIYAPLTSMQNKAVEKSLSELKNIGVHFKKAPISATELFSLGNPSINKLIRYVVIFSSRQNSCSIRKGATVTANIRLDDGIERHISFIELCQSSSMSLIDTTRTLLHEIGHILGFTHFPLSFSPKIPTCMTAPGEPASMPRLMKSLELAKNLDCSVWWDNDPAEESIMFCRQSDTVSNSEILLTDADKIAFKQQFDAAIKHTSSEAHFNSHIELLSVCENNTDRNCTVTLGELSQLRQRRLQISESSKNATCPLEITPPKKIAETLADRLTYSQIKDGAIRAFIFALSTTLVKQLSSNVEFKHISHQNLEIVINFIITTLIYSFPVAVTAVGTEHSCNKLKEYLKDHPTYIWMLPYVKLLAPIVVGTIYQFWLTQQLSSAVQKTAALSLELAVNMLSGLLGSTIVITGSQLLSLRSTKEKRD